MNTSVVGCPHCRAAITNDGSLSGMHVACPKCANSFEMPPIGAAVSPPIGGSPVNYSPAMVSPQIALTPTESTIRTLLLVSAVSNVLFGLLLILSIIGFPFGAALIALAVFEVLTYFKMEREPVSRLVSQIRLLAIFDIVTIVCFNIPSAVCGLVTLVNLPKCR